MKYRHFLIIVLFSVFYILSSHRVFSFDSTSATFELHAGDAESITGSSSSATFVQQEAGGQTATGSSTAPVMLRSISSGILYWLSGWYTPRYDQIHYRWRNDDGSESTATFAANEDTALINVPKNSIRRLRFEIANKGWTRGAAQQFKLEYAQTSTCSSGSYVAVPNDYSLHWNIATTTNITNDGDPTTNFAGSLTDANITFVTGQIKKSNNLTGTITVNSDGFTEIEYAIIATNNAGSGGNNYCFRLTNNGSVTNYVYDVYAQATLQSGLPVSGILTSAVFDTTASSDGPAYNSMMWRGNVGTGKVRFQLATSPNTTGPWTYYGSDGTNCGTSYWYDTSGSDSPVELKCSPLQHNNQRYYKYKVQICSNADCATSGTVSPLVNEVIVNWSP